MENMKLQTFCIYQHIRPQENLDLALQKCMFCAKGLPLRPETTLSMEKRILP